MVLHMIAQVGTLVSDIRDDPASPRRRLALSGGR